MAYGLVFVTSPIGAEGISSKDEEILMIADNEDESAQKTSLIYSDRDLSTKLSTNARKHVEEYFSPEQARNTLNQIINHSKHKILILLIFCLFSKF